MTKTTEAFLGVAVSAGIFGGSLIASEIIESRQNNEIVECITDFEGEDQRICVTSAQENSDLTDLIVLAGYAGFTGLLFTGYVAYNSTRRRQV